MDKKVTDKQIDRLAGVEVDIADNEKDTRHLVKERTKTINDNPRDNKIDN